MSPSSNPRPPGANLAPYRAIFANATDGIAIIDREATYIEQNPAHRIMLGYSDEDLIGRTPALHLGEEVFQRMAKELTETGRFQGEVRSRRKDGRWIDIALSAFGIYDDKREVLCYAEVKRDITARKQAEEAMARQAQLLRLSHDAILVWRLDGTIVSWNRGAEELYGFTESEAVGRAAHELLQTIHPVPWPDIESALRRHSRWEGELRHRTKDGREVIVSARHQLIVDADGRFYVLETNRDITESERVEQDLRAARDTFRHLVEQSPFGVYVVNADFRLVQVSAGARKVFQNVRPLLGRDFADVLRHIWPEPFSGEAIGLFRHTLETGEPYHAPATVERRRDSGEVESYDWKIERLMLPDGRWGVVCHFYDLSERQRYEEALKDSEARFRDMADNLLQFAWMADPKGWIFWYNRRWFDYTGTTLEQMQGWGWKAVHHPDHVDRVVARIQRSWDTGEIWEDTFPLRGRDGQYRWFLSRAVPIRDADGNITRWFGTNTDITDLREAQQAQARLAAIVTYSDDAIISKDLNGIIMSWNRGAERLFGYTEQEAIGRSVTMLMPLERMNEEPEILARIRRGESIEHYETVRRRKDGTLLDISLTVSPIKDDEGRIIGASKVARDITDRKRQEEELRRWKDELGTRVQERTEELLATQARLMKMTSQLSLTEQQERRKLARELHDYLAQMLVVGQMKTGMLEKQVPPNPASTGLLQDLGKVFQEALTYTRTLIAELSPPSLEDSGLPIALKWLAERFAKDGFKVDVQVDCASIPLPEEQSVVVFQAVRELLFNVMKHAGVDQATVTVTPDQDNSLRVAVTDHGKGLSPDALQRSAQPGHLGLISVRERFRAMGGRVDVESRPGQGTTVTLRLPLTKSAETKVLSPKLPEMQSSALRTQHSALPKQAVIRVLLVDDHKPVRQGLRDLLASDDRIRVVGEAGTCEEALMLAANLVPDVVVTDINLPDMDGIEATKRFKTLHPQTVVIGLSVHTEEHMKREMVSAGAETLLSKEWAAEELIAMIVKCRDERLREPPAATLQVPR
ncbi:MAG: putative histidine-kinase [Nitrospira sp.]|jgi:PAS domain S-box-containing protein|nr:MAG: putative histidine-kinase [Nitrospira sp.]